MSKPGQASGYKQEVTENCERVLVTLLRGLGPWKDSVYLVGGLTPRYLIKAKPPEVPAHAGTGDVDVVVELEILAETEAYHSLEENFKRLDFERSENIKGEKLTWRWQAKIESGATIILELLADAPELGGGKVQPLPTEGNISALNIPHCSMVFDHYETKELSAELLDANGIAIETIRHADIVSFVCLKAFAFDHRSERKDAHDLVYCLEYYEGGPDAVAKALVAALEGKHKKAVDATLNILGKRFADDDNSEGYLKDGPVAVAKFELGDDDEMGEPRALRQRDASELVMRVLQGGGR